MKFKDSSAFPLPAGLRSRELAVDLGTANTLVFERGRGVTCREPSVVALSPNSATSDRVLAVGTAAREMIGRTSQNIQTVRPIRDGVISDFQSTGELLRHCVSSSGKRLGFRRPKVVIAVPCGVSEVEKRAIRESAGVAGAKKVVLVEEPFAAAVGAGLPVTDARASTIVDIGGGTTEIAIISLGGIVYSNSVTVAGDSFDREIQAFARKYAKIAIGEQSAERLKIQIGSALPTGDKLRSSVRGRDLVSSAPAEIEVNEDDIRFALAEDLWALSTAVQTALEQAPPELSADILRDGIVLSGGGALLRNVDRFLEQRLGVKVRVTPDPMTAVIRGSGMLLDDPALLSQIQLR